MCNVLYLSYFYVEIKGHIIEIQSLTTRLQQTEIRIQDSGNEIEKIHNVVRSIKFYKEKVIRRFSILREYLAPKVVILQRKLEECLSTKNSYNEFSYSDLSTVEVASYALCALINILDIVKGNWKKEFDKLKIDFVDCISRMLS